MATYLEKLLTAQDQLTDILIDLTVNPKPDYQIDGQKVLWGEYLDRVTKGLEELNVLISQAAPTETRTISNYP